jgi:hypothetical protein
VTGLRTELSRNRASIPRRCKKLSGGLFDVFTFSLIKLENYVHMLSSSLFLHSIHV